MFYRHSNCVDIIPSFLNGWRQMETVLINCQNKNTQNNRKNIIFLWHQRHSYYTVRHTRYMILFVHTRDILVCLFSSEHCDIVDTFILYRKTYMVLFVLVHTWENLLCLSTSGHFFGHLIICLRIDRSDFQQKLKKKKTNEELFPTRTIFSSWHCILIKYLLYKYNLSIFIGYFNFKLKPFKARWII